MIAIGGGERGEVIPGPLGPVKPTLYHVLWHRPGHTATYLYYCVHHTLRTLPSYKHKTLTGHTNIMIKTLMFDACTSQINTKDKPESQAVNFSHQGLSSVDCMNLKYKWLNYHWITLHNTLSAEILNISSPLIVKLTKSWTFRICKSRNWDGND